MSRAGSFDLGGPPEVAGWCVAPVPDGQGGTLCTATLGQACADCALERAAEVEHARAGAYGPRPAAGVGDVVLKRHTNGGVEVLTAPARTSITLEALRHAGDALAVHGDVLTIAGQVAYRVRRWSFEALALELDLLEDRRQPTEEVPADARPRS